MPKSRPVIMPHGAREIVQSLISEYHFSVNKLAKALNISPRTVYRILSDKPISDKLLAEIITLYCNIASQAQLVQDQMNDDE